MFRLRMKARAEVCLALTDSIADNGAGARAPPF
jgi:hypothetical protein